MVCEVSENEEKIIMPVRKKGRRSKVDNIIFESQMKAFAESLIKLNKIIDIDGGVSSRGWCYLLEGKRLIDKSQFDECQELINECRKEGYLPIDFCALDRTRDFENVESLFNGQFKEPFEYLVRSLLYIRDHDEDKDDVSFWESQKCYIQMMVEKIDVLNLFKGTCAKYHIPIANAKGWSDLNSRNQLAERFKEAEEQGLKTVLLYYGDFDPAGLLIADTIKKNLEDIQKATKYDPKNLIIERFGLSIDFITANHLLWIENLITGSKLDLSNPKHADHKKAYVQDYLKAYGVRKCEANAILPIKELAIQDCERTILKHLGSESSKEYDKKLKEAQKAVRDLMESVDLKQIVNDLIHDLIEKNPEVDLDFYYSYEERNSSHDLNSENIDKNDSDEIDDNENGENYGIKRYDPNTKYFKDDDKKESEGK